MHIGAKTRRKTKKKKEKKRTNKLKKKDRSKRKSTNENYIMYNVYIIYMYRKTSGMKIKIKEEKKRTGNSSTHISNSYITACTRRV